jgi:hypothetical protein
MNMKKKLVISAAIAVPVGLGIAGTAYAATDAGPAKAPVVSGTAAQHGPGHFQGGRHEPGHQRPSGVEHGPDHVRR